MILTGKPRAAVDRKETSQNIYSDETKNGISDFTVDFFNASMDYIDLSSSDGSRLLSNIQQYIRSKGYEFDSGTFFNARSIYGYDYPLETFYYKDEKDGYVLALSATGDAHEKNDRKNYERAKLVADARRDLIEPAVPAISVTAPDKDAYLRETANREVEWPTGGKKKFSENTLRKWLSAYNHHGTEGLMPKPRSTDTRSNNLMQASREHIDQSHYNSFRIKKCSIYDLDKLKSRPPLPSNIKNINYSTDLSVTEHSLDNITKQKDEAYKRPWWEFGKSAAKEVFRYAPPSIREKFDSLDYECKVDLDKSQITYQRYVDLDDWEVSPDEKNFINFDLSSKQVGVDFYPDSECDHIDLDDFSAIEQQLDILEWNDSRPFETMTAKEMFASQGFEFEEHKSPDTGKTYELEFLKSRQGKEYDGRASYSEHDHIIFDLDLQTIKFREGRYWPVLNLNADEFAAVSKQVEELGWDKSKSESKTNDGLSSEFQSKDDFDIDI